MTCANVQKTEFGELKTSSHKQAANPWGDRVSSLAFAAFGLRVDRNARKIDL